VEAPQPLREEDVIRLLALDIGTNTGWALSDNGEITSGTKKLLTAKEQAKQKQDKLDRCCDVRFRRLKEFIASFGKLDALAFEDVQFLSTQLQAQLWAGLRTTVILNFPETRVLCLPVGSLKKFATGSGNAKKEQMLGALLVRHPDHFEGRMERGGVTVYEKKNNRPVDDNEADAFHLLIWAQEVLK
jgi:hypothetical protein